MKTTKPVSTISFNTTNYLRQKCDELYKAGIIEFYAFIPHKGENAETGPEAVQKKDHAHVWIVPSCNMQTENLREAFKEPDPANPEKPLGVLPFHKSTNFGDWVLYSLHDMAYLAEKDLEKEYHYDYDDIVTSDKDELYRLYSSIDMKSLMPYNNIIKAARNGMTFSEFMNINRMPIKQVGYWQKVWDIVAYDFKRKYEQETPWKITEEDREIAKENKRKLKEKKGLLRDEWLEANENPFGEEA